MGLGVVEINGCHDSALIAILKTSKCRGLMLFITRFLFLRLYVQQLVNMVSKHFVHILVVVDSSVVNSQCHCNSEISWLK